MKNDQKMQHEKDRKEVPAKMTTKSLKDRAKKSRELWVAGYPSYFGGA